MSGPDHSILVNDIYIMFGSLLDCSARATFFVETKSKHQLLARKCKLFLGFVFER